MAAGTAAPTANKPATTMLAIRQMALERDMVYSLIDDLTGVGRPNSHKKSHLCVTQSQVGSQALRE